VEHRQTKLAEDKAYSLQGISAYILPIYGEGKERLSSDFWTISIRS
jgi:hypothetical protein